MKQLFTYLAGFSLLTFTTVSCTKDAHNEMKQPTIAPQVLAAKVLPGETYVLNMGPGASASIVTQALHYEFSQISTASDGSAVYKYAPGKGYTGSDEVTLQQTITSITSSGGGCHNGNHSEQYSTTATKTMVIKFNVAN